MVIDVIVENFQKNVKASRPKKEIKSLLEKTPGLATILFCCHADGCLSLHLQRLASSKLTLVYLVL